MGNKMNRIHGLRISGFGFGRRLGVPSQGDPEPAQFSRLAVDDADRHVEEAGLPRAVFGLLHTDRFARERAANVDQIAPPLDLAVGSDLANRRQMKNAMFDLLIAAL
jgi:hypothetical protein